MGIQVRADKTLVWDNETDTMVVRTAVSVAIVGNHGSEYAIEGPIYCQSSQEIFEASQMLRQRLVSTLVPSGIDDNRII